jgi:L-malate glycosyltransferase
MSQKINILFVIDVLPTVAGGTEQHLCFLLRELPRDQFEPHFVALSEFELGDGESIAVEPILLTGYRGRLRAWARIRHLASLIRSLEIDVVHAFCPISELTALLATRLAGRGRVLAVRRNIGYWHTAGTLWRARLLRWMGGEYLANCQAAKDFAVAREWIPPHRIGIIRNPVSTSRLADGLAHVVSAASLGLGAGEKLIGMVAAVRPIKDHATLIHAAQLVLRQHPRTRFLMVGYQSADYCAQMQALARRLGIDSRVSWSGAVANPFALLPHFHVGVLSSQSEAFSNALLEYAAAGVAAVATDVGGTREVIVDGETGFIVPPRSAELLAERINRLLSDDALRNRFGTAARQRAQSLFSEERVLGEYGAVYRRLAGRPTEAVARAAGKMSNTFQPAERPVGDGAVSPPSPLSQSPGL